MPSSPRGMVRCSRSPSHILAKDSSTWAFPAGPSTQETPKRRKPSSPSIRWGQLYLFAPERRTMGKLLPAASHTQHPTPPNQASLQW